ncbi:MAG: hypothetical protein AB7O97_20075 [Planctomycetota bacterium]
MPTRAFDPTAPRPQAAHLAPLLTLALGAVLPAQTDDGAAAPPALVPFTSRSNVFRLDLPPGWRQLAPGELPALQRAVPDLPLDVGRNEPALFYAVGPIDRWLDGDFDGVYLYVVEQDNEWHLDDDLGLRLQQMWDRKAERDGVRYEVLDVERVEVGPDRNPAVRCQRRITPAKGKPQLSLDVHVPTGGLELTLCFTAPAAGFAALELRFAEMLATLQLARRARGEADLGDRLWTPAIAGAAVGLVLLVLYRRTRRPPMTKA